MDVKEEVFRLSIDNMALNEEIQIIKTDQIVPLQRRTKANNEAIRKLITERDQVFMDLEDNSGDEAA